MSMHDDQTQPAKGSAPIRLANDASASSSAQARRKVVPAEVLKNCCCGLCCLQQQSPQQQLNGLLVAGDEEIGIVTKRVANVGSPARYPAQCSDYRWNTGCSDRAIQ